MADCSYWNASLGDVSECVIVGLDESDDKSARHAEMRRLLLS
jgi:hypothetical protein